MAACGVLLLAGPVLADSNSDYRAGSDFAHQIQGQGTDSIQGFNPQDSIPGYNANPDETKYYGGVTAGGDSGLKNDGTTQWATGETGKTITESFMNKPKDILSPDAPFIETGRDVINRADNIVGNTGQQCSAQEINRSEFTNYTCERDTTVEEYCTRTASITGDWKETTEVKTYTLTAFSFSRNEKLIVFSVTAPEAGIIRSASLNVTTQNYLWNSAARFMNSTFNMTWNSTITLSGATGMTLSKGQVLSGISCSGNGYCTGTLDDRIFNELTSGRTRLTLTLVMQVKDREWIPRVEWVESCPFNKVDGVLKGTECTEPGGTKTGIME
ncbi:conjugal transfer protein TraN, partial [Salmonella enterica]|nr:conjugal transfer protein TraN [Salmonella enterica]